MKSGKTIDISKSSLVSLKAELSRKQQEVREAKVSEGYIKLPPRPKEILQRNPGVEERNRQDEELSPEELDLLSKSREVLAVKSRLYEELERGRLAPDEKTEHYLVDFRQKDVPRGEDRPQEQPPTPLLSGGSTAKEEEEDEGSLDDSDSEDSEWVDYTDCLGRTRSCHRSELTEMKERDRQMASELDKRRKASSTQPQKEVDGERSGLSAAGGDGAAAAELLSADMERELSRLRWERQEAELRDKQDIHYEDILFDGVAEKTNQRAGDGTTTAMLLAREITRSGFSSLAGPSNPALVRSGLLKGLDLSLELLDKITRPVSSREEIKNVATISSNGDNEIGELIATAFEKVGKNGIVTVKDGKTVKDSIEPIEGIQIENGYVSPSFVNSKGSKVLFENSLVLFCDMKITSVRQIINILEGAASLRKPLVIVAEDFEEEAIFTMILNKMKGTCRIVGVKSPGVGDYRRELLGDMAAATGGKVYGDEASQGGDDRSKKILPSSYFGSVGQVLMTSSETLLLDCGGRPEEIQARSEQISGLMEQVDNPLDLQRLKERLARLSRSVAIIQVGGGSEAELRERKDRIEDALHATRAALEEGIVPGGGLALLRCVGQLERLAATTTRQCPDEAVGLQILARALRTPCATIAGNAGVDPAVVVNNCLRTAESDRGYDARSGQYVDMIQAGIIDPTKVVKTSLSDAAVAASLLLTAEAAVTFVFDGDEIVLG